MTSTTHKYDVVIVGGGISGLYTAWRLASNTTYSIAVLEYSGRFGGRYRTCQMPGGFPAELGSMRFLPQYHHILNELLQELRIRIEPYFSPNDPFKSIYYVKGKLCHSEEERNECFGIGKDDNNYIGHNIVNQIDLPEDGNFFKATLRGSSQLARNVSLRQLWAESSNSGVVECESPFVKISHTLAGHCAFTMPYFRASNDDKGGRLLMTGFSDGAETVIDELVRRLTSLNVTLLKQHNVTRVEELKTKFKVKAITNGSTPAWFLTDRLILACNERGAELITWISEADRTTELQKLLGHINKLVGMKSVFTYSEAFWEKKGLVCGTLQSDRLCSHFDILGDRGKKGGYASLYIYHYGTTEILEGLNKPEEERYQNKEGDIPYDLVPSRVAVEAIQRELREIFSDIEVPEPASTCMMDWSVEPYGCCCRTPKLGVDHNKVYWKSLKPFGEHVEVYMIGDSFAAFTRDSGLYAWTEGVLLTAERVLHRYFQLNPYKDGLDLENPWPQDS